MIVKSRIPYKNVVLEPMMGDTARCSKSYEEAKMKLKHAIKGALIGGLIAFVGIIFVSHLLIYILSSNLPGGSTPAFFDPITIAVSIYFGLMGSPLGLIIGGFAGGAFFARRERNREGGDQTTTTENKNGQ